MVEVIACLTFELSMALSRFGSFPNTVLGNKLFVEELCRFDRIEAE